MERIFSGTVNDTISVQLQGFKTIMQSGARGFGCVPATPIVRAQSPSNLDTRREDCFKAGHGQSNKAGERSHSWDLYGP